MGGGASKKAAAAANQQRQEELRLMREQLALQRGQLSSVTGGVGGYLSPEGIGFSDAELAAMRGQALEGVDASYSGIESALKTQLARRGAAGGQIPISGDFLRNTGNLMASKEGLRASMLRDITVKDALLKLQNRFAAANAILGVSSQYNPAPFLSAAGSSLSTYASAAQAQDQARSGIYGALIGAGASVLGGTLAPGGIFNKQQPSGGGGCWIAEAIYGPGMKTTVLRGWLNNVWAKRSVFNAAVMAAYRMAGRRVAWLVERSGALKAAFRPLFDAAFAEATQCQ